MTQTVKLSIKVIPTAWIKRFQQYYLKRYQIKQNVNQSNPYRMDQTLSTVLSKTFSDKPECQG